MPFKIDKLRDEFGQYTLMLKCDGCLRERRTTPNMIAHIMGGTRDWLMWRGACVAIMCGAKRCSVRAVPVTVPRGYKNH
jgi:hypothetical protein